MDAAVKQKIGKKPDNSKKSKGGKKASQETRSGVSVGGNYLNLQAGRVVADYLFVDNELKIPVSPFG